MRPRGRNGVFCMSLCVVSVQFVLSNRREETTFCIYDDVGQKTNYACKIDSYEQECELNSQFDWTESVVELSQYRNNKLDRQESAVELSNSLTGFPFLRGNDIGLSVWWQIPNSNDLVNLTFRLDISGLSVNTLGIRQCFLIRIKQTNTTRIVSHFMEKSSKRLFVNHMVMPVKSKATYQLQLFSSLRHRDTIAISIPDFGGHKKPITEWTAVITCVSTLGENDTYDIFVSFTIPPPQFNVSQMNIKLVDDGGEGDITKEKTTLLGQQPPFVEFHNIRSSTQNYLVWVTPYDPFWSTPGKCLCKDSNGDCGSCLTTTATCRRPQPTKSFNMKGSVTPNVSDTTLIHFLITGGVIILGTILAVLIYRFWKHREIVKDGGKNITMNNKSSSLIGVIADDQNQTAFLQNRKYTTTGSCKPNSVSMDMMEFPFITPDSLDTLSASLSEQMEHINVDYFPNYVPRSHVDEDLQESISLGLGKSV